MFRFSWLCLTFLNMYYKVKYQMPLVTVCLQLGKPLFLSSPYRQERIIDLFSSAKMESVAIIFLEYFVD